MTNKCCDKIDLGFNAGTIEKEKQAKKVFLIFCSVTPVITLHRQLKEMTNTAQT
jgi:hypothetical protein